MDLLAKKLKSVGKSQTPIQLKNHSGDPTSDPDQIVYLFCRVPILPLWETHTFLLRKSSFSKTCTLWCYPRWPLKMISLRWYSAWPLNCLRLSKMPGPEWFSGIYYKNFSSLLIPHLTKLLMPDTPDTLVIKWYTRFICWTTKKSHASSPSWYI